MEFKKVENGTIDFEDVSSHYGNDEDILSRINLHIPSGSTLGILGATGSSKSSLVQLIPRLYDVTKGSVKVAGMDVRDYDLKVLRDNVAMVLQKNVLFSGTIKENMRWGNPNATDDEIMEACKLAQADEFIQLMPNKYDTYIEQGGSNVSGGQRQRLCIARAILKSPKILILDDSTSAVDTKTDALIRQAFLEKIPHTTRIIISQRVSSIQDADQILVIDDGKVSGLGTHEELLKSNAMYKETLKHKTMEVILMNNRSTNSLKRVIKETITSYKIESFIVLVLIIVSSIANVYGSMFLKSLIDDYIVPLLSQTVPNYVPLLNALMKLVMIYGVGILATYGFNRIMVTISLGTLKHIRDELFEHMQTLPLRFFDTHAHGDIMSVYTNDTDTLRQLISQSIPQVIVSLMTIISVTISMFILNVPLAVLTIACGLLMVYTSKRFRQSQVNTLLPNKNN